MKNLTEKNRLVSVEFVVLLKKNALYIKDIVYADKYFPIFERVLNTKA